MDEIINKLVVKYNLDYEVVNRIVRSEFNFVMDTMEEGGLESIHLHHLGKFAAKTRYTKIDDEHNQ
mgnify:CR=1 FL=1